jgi:uncharacterized protein YvpB
MDSEREERIQLNVPFYNQHFDFSCGPASLMMAMKYFDEHLPLTKELEIDIWREANMVEIYGASRFGLAYAAAIRGFCAMVTSKSDTIDFVDTVCKSISDLNQQMLKLHFYERRDRCKKVGVQEKHSPITGETIYNSLLSEHVPLLVTNNLYCGGENLPHWITVTGIDENFVYFNNSLNSEPVENKFKRSDIEEVVGYQGEQSMVEIWK